MSGVVSINGTTLVDATGLAYGRVIGVEGAALGSATARLFPVKMPGIDPHYNLPAGTTALTISLIMSGAILTSRNPAATTITLPTMATLGYSPPTDGTGDLRFRFQVCGLGGLFINPATGVKIIWNGMDPQYLSQFSPIGMLSYVGIDTDSAETWVAN